MIYVYSMVPRLEYSLPWKPQNFTSVHVIMFRIRWNFWFDNRNTSIVTE